MNLDACTPNQRRSIEHVSGPLLVSAGAGSGKTFTLTQRIAYALLPESGPAVSSIDEVLAITFTEKAAAEIKARVKRTLRAEGLAEEALRVDGAWISTIHGMCARILRAHALDLGLDPAFGIMGDAERADAIADAIDSALGEDNDIIARGSFAALFDEYPARSAMRNATSVASLLQTLLDKAVGLRGGLEALDFGPAPVSASVIAGELLLAYEGVLPALEQAGTSAAAERSRAQAADAAGVLGAFLADASVADDMRALAGVVDDCAYLPCTFGNADVKAAVKAYQASHVRAAQNVALALAYPLTTELATLAQEVSARYEDTKRAVCMLDNDDLLVRTLDAFERCPDIAARYEHRFKLVMVDEFQDTSQLQIDMIARLAGQKCAHLCTVGDAQQSIYRFRGADVNVYEAHKRAMRADDVGALYVELTKNFRSHGDVLSFVDRVFEQPTVFGDAFMSLTPNEQRPTRYRGCGPRIDLVLSVQPSGRGSGVHIAEVKRSGAEAIARRFAALREDGHAPGDMVVLLGKMGRANMYAEALRAEGFECVVTGGSLFASAPEVRVVARFVEALANPANTAALFEVLTSDMVRLSADDLLMLSTEEDPETKAVRRRDLDRGFARLGARVDDLPPRLAHGVRLFARAQREVYTHTVADVVRNAVVRSGWMARLEEEGATGTARAANVLKAIRLIESLESERHGALASTARALADELAVGLKEAPGALSGIGGSVVRIMTIHASKGLEFPIVALADFADAQTASGKLLVETCDAVACASLAPAATLDAFPQLAKRAKGTIDACQGDASQAAYRSQLACRAADEELAEARRKLYVGLTRASEALIVAMSAKAPAAKKAPSYPPLVDDIRSALVGASDFPEGEAALAYGGSAPARFESILVQATDEAAEQGAATLSATAPARFMVPLIHDESAPARLAYNATRANVLSYSSIASNPTPSPHAGAPRAADGDKATDLGSAFHRAAQLAIETGHEPSPERLCILAKAYDLTSDQHTRLVDACARWFASSTYASVCSWAQRRAEVPFYVALGDVFLEGEIDLLCTDSPVMCGAQALVVDYKTGGSDGEALDALHDKHLLQAQCYAYALLQQGCAAVQLCFARVECEWADGVQTVSYRFAAEEREDIAERILQQAKAHTMVL